MKCWKRYDVLPLTEYLLSYDHLASSEHHNVAAKCNLTEDTHYIENTLQQVLQKAIDIHCIGTAIF